MQKEIRYNGFTEQPSDYECLDGDLAAVSGLVPEDEALRPIAEPQPLFTLPDGCLISYIHAGIGYKHYIIKHEYDTTGTPSVHKTDFYWLDAATIDSAAQKPVDITLSSDYLIKSFDNITTYKVDGIGNTIVILTDSGMHYCLWKDSTYNYLGNHLPELTLSFGLQQTQENIFKSSAFDLGHSIQGDPEYIFTDEDRRIVTNNVLGTINEWIRNRHSEGYFIFPFFVRYAYRLYDGTTLTMHSAPILMIPNTGFPHVYFYQTYSNETKYSYASVDRTSVLEYAYIDTEYHGVGTDNPTSKELIQQWSDIIQSIDIFISAPIYTYNQNGEISGTTTNADDVIDWTQSDPWDYSVVKVPGLISRHTLLPTAAQEMSRRYSPNGFFYIPMKTRQEVFQAVSDCHTFYFLKSISIDSLTTDRQQIKIESILPNIQQQEVMSDDYDSHDMITPKLSFPYNQRLSIADITKKACRGYNLKAMLPFTDAHYTWNTDHYDIDYDPEGIAAYIYLRKNGKEVVVKDIGTTAAMREFGKKTPIPYYYYPDREAFKVLIHYSFWSDTPAPGGLVNIYRQLDLKPHPYLNGAYFVTQFDAAHEPGSLYYDGQQGPLNIKEQNRIYTLPNRIYTSEVNNPFAFPVRGVTTIGTGSILGIKAAVKALSPSQFGQFPLYAFCTDGVWALTVSSDGSYSASQPATLDVCISADSITQIESAVLFATQRGIMLISGSTSTCISDNINSKLAFDLDTLPGLRQLIGEEIADSLDHVHFIEYLQQARMLFDYTHQRIIVYNPNHNYAYAYSLKSKQWGMLLSYIKDAPNSYPDALAFAELPTEGGGQTNTILNYSAEKADAEYTGTKKLIITRPLKLDIADQLKTIDTIIQRGQFRKGHVKTILYGSRDLFNWQLIYSSTDHYLRGFRGTPYKYFRIVLLCEGMTPDESIFGCSVEYQPRLTGKLR